MRKDQTMKKRTWSLRVGALCLMAVCLAGGVLAAAGDASDPLITLSYLNTTVTPGIIKEVETKAEALQNELKTQFDTALNEYKSQPGAGASGAAYTVVTLTSGQALSLDVGCEVLLRVGTAKVNAATATALIDTTTGGSIEHGASLTQNHLYLATISERTVEATAATVKLMVRGAYTIH